MIMKYEMIILYQQPLLQLMCDINFFRTSKNTNNIYAISLHRSLIHMNITDILFIIKDNKN